MESEKSPLSSKSHLSISCPMWERKSGWPPLVHTDLCGLLVPSTVREAAAIFLWGGKELNLTQNLAECLQLNKQVLADKKKEKKVKA